MNGIRTPFTLLIAGCFTAVLLAFTAGPYDLSLSDVAGALLAGPNATQDASVVVWRLRLPRVLTGILVGAALSAAGATYQSIFRNPLVSPDILGVSAGAGLGAALAIYWGMVLGWVQLLAFGGGIAAVVLVYWIAGQVRRHDPVLVLVLAGVAVGTLSGAGISLVKILADPSMQLPTITYWLLGGLNTATTRDIFAATPPVAVGLTGMLLLRWRVNLLTLADEEAASLGVNVARTRVLLITAATLLTAASVAIAGVVGWVGLIVPHTARLLVGPEFSRLLPASMLLGAAFLLIADTLARSVAVIELPLGILTALAGAPAFLFLLARSGRTS